MKANKILKITAALAFIFTLAAPVATVKADTTVSEIAAEETAHTTEAVVPEENTGDEAASEVKNAEATEADNKKSETDEEPFAREVTEIEKKWAGKVMVITEDYVNVRKKADKDSDIVGKMYYTTVADVIETDEEWTLIKSGNVKGYIKTDDCVFGAEAYENMKTVCFKAATVTSSTLNIRSKADDDSKILTTVDNGTELKFLSTCGDDWVKVKDGNVTGYVFKKYVDIGYNTSDAKTVSEIKAAKKAEEAAKEASKNAYSATDDEVKLLAALIYCEAGGEPYEGMVAVGAVVMNRVKSNKYPNTIKDVIYAPYQFGPARSGLLEKALRNGSATTSCVKAAKEALAGADPTGGLLCFNRNNGRGKLVIGHQMFY